MKRIAAGIAHAQGTILKVALSAIVLVFIGILVMVYFVAKEANPILLDETGRPIDAHHNAESAGHHP